MSAIGIIAPLEIARIAQSQGIDYVEPTVMGNVVLRGDDNELSLNPAFAGARFPSFAILVPRDLNVSDPGVPIESVQAFFESVFPLLRSVAEPGAKIVFGSGTSRRIPDSVDRHAGEQRFARSLTIARDIAAAHDLRVMLEPLNRTESNLINSIDEAADFLRRFGITGVPIVADMFHIEEEGESLSTVREHIDQIGHAHIADADRLWLGAGKGDWREFVSVLRDAGYDGPISLECKWGDDPSAEIAASIAALREADSRQDA